MDFKYLNSGLVASLLLVATACSSDDVVSPAPQDGEALVSFTVALPADMSSRTYNDGKSAVNLEYAVYDASGEHLRDLDGTATMVDLRATIQLRLANSREYSVVFWASAPGSPYTFTSSAATVAVDYSAAIEANDDVCDAFYAKKDVTVNGTLNETVELRRPFAQINVGATDADAATAAGWTTTHTTVGVSKVYGTLNLLSGIVSDNQAFEFTYAAKPGAGETFPVAGVNYQSMVYVLTDADRELVDVTFRAKQDGVTGEVVRNYSNVPVQRNYRTNIYGNILTEEANFNVVIKPDWDGEENIDVTYVSSGAQLVAAIRSGASDIVATENLNIANQGAIEISTPTTLTLAPGTVLSNEGGQQTDKFLNDSELTINAEGATVNLQRQIAWNYGTMTVNGGTFTTSVNNGGTAFLNDNTGSRAAVEQKLILKGVTIKASFFAVGGYGDFEIEDCVIESTSSSKYGSWAYTVRPIGGHMTIKNSTVRGVQGCIAVIDGGYCVVDNCVVEARNSDAAHNDAFYALYTANTGTIEVLSGDFSSDRNPCVYSSDDDLNTNVSGYVILKGGRFSSQPVECEYFKNEETGQWSGTNHELAPAAGYKYETISDGRFVLQVVPE